MLRRQQPGTKYSGDCPRRYGGGRPLVVYLWPRRLVQR
jgi:hypothetical protein